MFVGGGRVQGLLQSFDMEAASRIAQVGLMADKTLMMLVVAKSSDALAFAIHEWDSA